LCVVNQVNGKEQGTQAGVYGGDETLAHKDGHNSEEQQDQEAAHQDATHHGEVVARLEGEASESQANCRSDYHGQENLLWSISTRCHAQQKGFGYGKDCQQDEVRWSLPPKILIAGQNYQGNKAYKQGTQKNQGVLGHSLSHLLVVVETHYEHQ